MKALSPGFAPAPFWHCAAEEIADHLQDYFSACSLQRNLPRQWNTGSLCLLPKHGRRTHVPQDLRPITLLEPCSKALLGTLAQHLMEFIGRTLCSVPQYAYLPGRGTEDALARVLRHCEAVRASCIVQQYPIQHHAQGLQTVQLGGGLMITLDLSKAFDMVPRCKLFQCLSLLGVPNSLLDFLHAIYFETSYTLQHRGQTRTLDTSRGIRQGCKAAPTLWAAYATGLLLNIGQHLDDRWLYDCITMYADDGCLHEVVTSPEQFRGLIAKIGTTLDLIEDAQLVVNFEKTYAMLRLVGTAVAKIQKQFIFENPKRNLFENTQKQWHYHPYQTCQTFSNIWEQRSATTILSVQPPWPGSKPAKRLASNYTDGCTRTGVLAVFRGIVCGNNVFSLLSDTVSMLLDTLHNQ